MKDLYTFDINEADASKTYTEVQLSYDNIFRELGVGYLKAAASSGSMGGSLSHEYHYLSPLGEDTLHVCQRCNYSANKEALAEEGRCPRCEQTEMTTERAIEVGHTFFLGTRYTEPLRAMVADKHDQQVTLQMGCYGIGLSRVLGAIASIFATPDGLRWPMLIAPYKVVLLTVKETENDAYKLIEAIRRTPRSIRDPEAPHPNIQLMPVRDMVIDDREKPFGWKMKDASIVGYPIVLKLGNKYRETNCVEVEFNLPTRNPERHPASANALLYASQLLDAMVRSLDQGHNREFHKSAKYLASESKRLREEWNQQQGQKT